MIKSTGSPSNPKPAIPAYARQQAADLACGHCGVIGEVALTVAEHNRNAVRATCSACGAYIRWVKTRPPAERQASRKRGIDAWMASQPASEKQLQFLRTLGHDRAPANKFEASQLIDALLGKGAAS